MQKSSSRHDIGHQSRITCSKIMARSSAVKHLRREILYLIKICNSRIKAEDVGNLEEGHFSVVTIGNEVKKFRVAPSYLAYPQFVKLLEAAEQEFGLDQPGVLLIPRGANELNQGCCSYHVEQMSSK